MKTLKRLHGVVVVLAALLAVAVPSISYAWSDAGTGPGPSSPEVEITGTVQSTGDAFVVVDGQTVQVDANTRMNGQFVVGDVVTIHASAGQNGGLVAREVDLVDHATGHDVQPGVGDTLHAGDDAHNVQQGSGNMGPLQGAAGNASPDHQGDNHDQGHDGNGHHTDNHGSDHHSDDHGGHDGGSHH